MPCKSCQERGQTWRGAPPQCAFVAGYSFRADNWNCALMNRLRELAEIVIRHWGITTQCVGDQHVALFLVPEKVEIQGAPLSLWLTWYKDRGCTSGAWLLFDLAVPRLPTEAECEMIAEFYEKEIGRV